MSLTMTKIESVNLPLLIMVQTWKFAANLLCANIWVGQQRCLTSVASRSFEVQICSKFARVDVSAAKSQDNL